jgi:hypothetical protein
MFHDHNGSRRNLSKDFSKEWKKVIEVHARDVEELIQTTVEALPYAPKTTTHGEDRSDKERTFQTELDQILKDQRSLSGAYRQLEERVTTMIDIYSKEFDQKKHISQGTQSAIGLLQTCLKGKEKELKVRSQSLDSEEKDSSFVKYSANLWKAIRRSLVSRKEPKRHFVNSLR